MIWSEYDRDTVKSTNLNHIFTRLFKAAGIMEVESASSRLQAVGDAFAPPVPLISFRNDG